MEHVARRVIAVIPMNPNPVTPRAIEIVRKWRGAPLAGLVPAVEDVQVGGAVPAV